MFETVEAIENQLLAGEDSLAEFKSVHFNKHGSVKSPNSEDFAGEMVAFANAEGGTIFLGVEDDGTVSGIPQDRLPRVEEWVVNIASNNCDPPLLLILRTVALKTDRETRRILLVTIPRGLFVSRLRVGSSRRDLRQAELARLLQERGRTFAFDETLVPGADPEDLDQATLEEHFATPGKLSWDQLLTNVRVLAHDAQGTLRPTVAGLLCFGKDPQAHLRSAAIQAAVYRDERRHSDDLIHSSEIGGRVQDQIDEAVAFVDRFMLRPARKDVGRRDFPQYVLGVVLEAIVNAVAHRDYSIAGSKIRLFMYSDRLEILSPGGLPNSLTLESLPYRQFTRNQLLVSFLAKMTSRRDHTRFIETRGEGVVRILEESQRHSGRQPSYTLHEQELALVIWGKQRPSDETYLRKLIESTELQRLSGTRVELYADAVDLLLRMWERGKGTFPGQRPDLKAVRRALEEMAYEAQASGAEMLDESVVLRALALASKGETGHQVLRWLVERSGLLVQRTDNTYSFAHRTFQEYLAASYLLSGPFSEDQIADLARSDRARWGEVVLLAAAKAALGVVSIPWSWAEALCFRDPDDPAAGREDANGALVAAQILAETVDLERVHERHRRRLDRVRAWMLHLMTDDGVSARDRDDAEHWLSRLGVPSTDPAASS